jgi:outer membrane protein TolC
MKRTLLGLLLTVAALHNLAGENLSLEQTRSLALANSRTLAKYNLAIKRNDLEEQSRRYSNLPSLSLGLSGSMTLWSQQQGAIQDSMSAGASFSVSQKIWDGGKNSVLKAINALSAGITRQEARSAYFVVLDEADTAYYAVLQAIAALDVATSGLETAALGLDIAKIRFENKMIGEVDYLEALSEQAAKETSLNQARRDLALGMARLRSLTGFRELTGLEPVDFTVYEDLIQHLAVLPEADTLDLYLKLWKITVANNPALAKAGLLSEKAREQVTQATRDYMPSFSASVSTGMNYTYKDGLDPSSVRFSLSGSIPLDFWVTRNNVEKQRIAEGEAVLDYQSALESLDIDLQTALLDAVSQAALVLSSRRAYEYAQKHFEYVLELYRLSRNSQSELSDAAATLSSNRNQLIRAQYGFLLSLSKLRSLGSFEDEGALGAILMAAP